MNRSLKILSLVVLLVYVLIVICGCSNNKSQAIQITSTRNSFTTKRARIEFYYVKNVTNNRDKNPRAYWNVEVKTEQLANKDLIAKIVNYRTELIFTNKKGETLSSLKNPKEVLEKVVDVNKNMPFLTQADLLPNAKAFMAFKQTRGILRKKVVSDSGHMILIEFNNHGKKIMSNFTGNHIGEYYAEIINGELYSLRRITSKYSYGKHPIDGFRTLQEAQDVANAIYSQSRMLN